MYKFVATFLLLVISASPAFCQISLKKEDRILNEFPGYCAWCCIETLGRHHNIETLSGLKEKRKKLSDFKTWDKEKKEYVDEPYIWVNDNGNKRKQARNVGDYTDIRNQLNAANVKYKIQENGNFSKDLIKYAIWNKLGCMIVVKDWTETTSSTHAIIIQTYDEKTVTFFDPNNIEENYSVTWAWFDMWWTGYILVIEGIKK